MKPWPLRRKIALWSASCTGLALLVFSLGTVINLYFEQVKSVDAELAGETRLLQAQSADGGATAAALRMAAAFHPWLQVGIFDGPGTLLHRTPKFPEALTRAASVRDGRHTTWVDWTLWRTHAAHWNGLTVVLAHSLDDKPDFVDDLLGAYLLSLPLALILVAATAWWLARRALAPVRALADAAGGVTADRLDVRLPVPPAQDELARLATVLNGMIERLERSFHQARRFAADASHELRTPLTIMRGEIEAALRHGGLGPDQEKRLVSLLEETARLDHITENLLLLARFDAGQTLLRLAPLDFSMLVADACDDAGLLAAGKNLHLENTLASGVRISGDAAHLRRVLLNLFDNAVKFNEPGGRISCGLQREPGAAVLTIGNTGPGIPAAHAARLFERFFRGGLAPGEVERGHGLGLSLCREIVRAHGGNLVLGARSGPDWTEFIVRLPVAPAT